MTRLDVWLERATRRLAGNSAAKVRAEIQEHYESARDAAIRDGESADEADRRAVNALGEAAAANCEHRKVLLTSAEARMLREGKWEARAICSRRWLKLALLAIPVAMLLAAAALFASGARALAGMLLSGGIGLALCLATPLLPLYTPTRSRVVRVVRQVVVTGTILMVFGGEALKWSWLLISCLWPMFWIEWKRSSIRRKLPVADWPKHLYLCFVGGICG